MLGLYSRGLKTHWKYLTLRKSHFLVAKLLFWDHLVIVTIPLFNKSIQPVQSSSRPSQTPIHLAPGKARPCLSSCRCQVGMITVTIFPSITVSSFFSNIFLLWILLLFFSSVLLFFFWNIVNTVFTKMHFEQKNYKKWPKLGQNVKKKCFFWPKFTPKFDLLGPN